MPPKPKPKPDSKLSASPRLYFVDPNADYRTAANNYLGNFGQFQTHPGGWDWKSALDPLRTAANNYFPYIDLEQGLIDLAILLELMTHHPSFIRNTQTEDPDSPDDPTGKSALFVCELHELGVEAGIHLIKNHAGQKKSAKYSAKYKEIVEHTTTCLLKCAKTSLAHAHYLNEQIQAQDQEQNQNQNRTQILLKKCIKRAEYSLKMTNTLDEFVSNSGLGNPEYKQSIASSTKIIEALKEKLKAHMAYVVVFNLFVKQANNSTDKPWDSQKAFEPLKNRLLAYLPHINNFQEGTHRLDELVKMIEALPCTTTIIDDNIITEVNSKDICTQLDLNFVSIKLICDLYELALKMGKHLIEQHPDEKNSSLFKSTLEKMAKYVSTYSAISIHYAAHLYHQDEHGSCQALCGYTYTLTEACNKTIDDTHLSSAIDRGSLVTIGPQLKDLNERSVLKNARSGQIAQIAIPVQSTTVVQDASATQSTTINSKRNYNKKTTQALKNLREKIELSNFSISELEAHIINLKEKHIHNTNENIKNKITLLINDIVLKIQQLKINQRSQTYSPASSTDGATTHEPSGSEDSEDSRSLGLRDDDELSSIDSEEHNHGEERNDVSEEEAILPARKYCKVQPKCLKNTDGRPSKFAKVIRELSEIFKAYKCDALLYGSAIYKINPGDLDILIPSQNLGIEKARELVDHILKNGGNLIAKYAKNKDGWYTYKLSYKGVDIDLISSPLSAEEHADTLDFTVGAMHYDMQKLQMRQPNHPSYINHLQKEKLAIAADSLARIKADPTIILRAVRAQEATGFKISNTLLDNINTGLENENLFEKINIDKLWLELGKLFFSGNATDNFNILNSELKVFNKLFSAAKTLRATELAGLNIPASNFEPSLANILTIMIERDPSIILRATHAKMTTGLEMPIDLQLAINNGFMKQNSFLTPQQRKNLCVEMEKLFAHTKILETTGAAALGVQKNNIEPSLVNIYALMIAQDPSIVLYAVHKQITTGLEMPSNFKLAINNGFMKKNTFLTPQLINNLCAEMEKLFSNGDTSQALFILGSQLKISHILFDTLNQRIADPFNISTKKIKFFRDNNPVLIRTLDRILKQDPALVLRAIHTQITTGTTISRVLFCAIKDAFQVVNLFFNLNYQDSCKEIEKLLTLESREIFFNILTKELNLFGELFMAINALAFANPGFNATLASALIIMIQRDPAILLRFVRAQAATGIYISNELRSAVQQSFMTENLFQKIDPEKLYDALENMFCFGSALPTLDILMNKLNIFDKLFSRFNTLEPAQKNFTMLLVNQVALEHDSRYMSGQVSNISFSLFFYAIHYFFLPKIFTAYKPEDKPTLATNLLIDASKAPQLSVKPDTEAHWSDQPVLTNCPAPSGYQEPFLVKFSDPVSSPEIRLNPERLTSGTKFNEIMLLSSIVACLEPAFLYNSQSALQNNYAGQSSSVFYASAAVPSQKLKSIATEPS